MGEWQSSLSLVIVATPPGNTTPRAGNALRGPVPSRELSRRLLFRGNKPRFQGRKKGGICAPTQEAADDRKWGSPNDRAEEDREEAAGHRGEEDPRPGRR